MTVRGAGSHILVVDDDEDSLQITRAVLAHSGYVVSVARTATEAMRIAEGADPPSLAVVDLVLPDFHGSELIPALRAVPALADLPVVAITGRLQRGVEIPPNTFSAACVLTKPVWPKELLAAVENCFASDTSPTLAGGIRSLDEKAPPRI